MRAIAWIAIASLAATVYVIIASAPPRAHAESYGKNLQVLSKDLSKKELRAIMKTASRAVGKTCDECHDLKDYAKDNELKKKAREMFRLTASINARLKKDGFKKRVKCVTCHAGEAKPK